MYENIVSALRTCVDKEKGCADCPYYHKCMNTIGKHAAMVDAADAIEKLSKPRWIPVTKGSPKTRESILGKKSNKVIVAFRFGDGTQGTDTAHTLNGEWVFEDHITVVERTITHWMPLPEPPKDEAK